MRFADEDGNGIIEYIEQDTSKDEIYDIHHYYPFGMQWDGSFGEKDGNKNKYLYNGKEEVPCLGLMYYGARYYDASVDRFVVTDPLADDFDLVGWSPFVYVWSNPMSFIDPSGMRGEGVENEYVKDKNTGEVVKISDVGGDEVDIVYDGIVNEDGSVTVVAESTEVMVVETTKSSGIDTRYTQDESPTPGERNIHGSIPLDVKAYVFLANLFSGGGASATLGFAHKVNKVRKAAKRGKASTNNEKKQSR